jgi:hypothetical protein
MFVDNDVESFGPIWASILGSVYSLNCILFRQRRSSGVSIIGLSNLVSNCLRYQNYL